MAKRRKNPFVQRHLRYPLEALGLKIAIVLLRSLSVERASDLCGWLGRSIGPRLGITHRAEGNLARAFPDMPRAERDRIVRDMWDNLGRVVGEYAHLQAIAAADSGRVDCVGLEHIDPLLHGKAPGILVSGHLANWEILPAVATREGLAMTNIVREPNNPLVRGTLAALRGFAAGQSIPKGPEGAKRAVKVLQNDGVLGLLIDQKMNQGIAVPFFGQPAKTAPAVAQLALRFRCPIYPARVERLGPARFRLTCYPPLALPDSGDRQADVLQVMTALNEMLEGWIRARPAEWFWLHRRWPKDRRPAL
ncbi:MAG TPA: lauroyl acyltransferase [Kiloniellaceae bacterium]|nr:lauroyl acyltransferase [Kiloniellaceae bacterium]